MSVLLNQYYSVFVARPKLPFTQEIFFKNRLSKWKYLHRSNQILGSSLFYISTPFSAEVTGLESYKEFDRNSTSRESHAIGQEAVEACAI